MGVAASSGGGWRRGKKRGNECGRRAGGVAGRRLRRARIGCPQNTLFAAAVAAAVAAGTKKSEGREGGRQAGREGFFLDGGVGERDSGGGLRKTVTRKERRI